VSKFHIPLPVSILAAGRERLLSISYREIDFDQRGFEPCDSAVRQRMEACFRRFLDGYHFALRAPSDEKLAARLDQEIEAEWLGFGYEGAGTCLALLDLLLPWGRGRLDRFVAGPARRHDFVTLIGIGLAFARLPWVRCDLDRALRRLDPRVCWFAVDGYGFHEGFFHHRRYVVDRNPPSRVSGYTARCFDNGLGRAIWFVAGGNPERIRDVVAEFPPERQGDLWAGVGLACTFAGAVHHLAEYAAVIDGLTAYARPLEIEFGLGVVFAAYAREMAGVPSPWAALACDRVLGVSLEEAGRLGRRALQETNDELAHAGADELRANGYERARQKIRQTIMRGRRREGWFVGGHG
jgi:Protein of unknown function (DUF1702)